MFWLLFVFFVFFGIWRFFRQRKLPSWEKIAPAVIVIRGFNPGPFTLQGTNTYLFGAGSKRILIDAGQGKPEYARLLSSILAKENAYISDIIITHRHKDHIDGIPSISSSKQKLWKRITMKDCAPEFTPVSDGQVFDDGFGNTIKVLFTPGHLDDHIVLFYDKEKALLSGDCILGQGSAVFENLSEYMDSLASIQKAFPDIKFIYPGHGPILSNGNAVIAKYIGHRLDRERQIIECLRASNQASATDLVKEIYRNYDPKVWMAAERVYFF